MNFKLILFVVSSLISSFAAHANQEGPKITEIPTLFKTVSHLKCQATRLIAGEKLKSGEVEINIDSTSELLIEVSFLKDASKDFKIGRRFTSGRDLTQDSDYKCTYFFDVISDSEAQVKYVCNDLESPKRTAQAGFSKFFYRSSQRTGAICKSLGSCWELSACANE